MRNSPKPLSDPLCPIFYRLKGDYTLAPNPYINIRATHPLPLIITPPTPLIINTPQIWYTIIYWEYLLLGGWGGLSLGGGDYMFRVQSSSYMGARMTIGWV